jgi:flagellar protein FlaF
MAVAEIIGAAIGVMLLVIVAYLLVGNVIATSEIVTTAQKDLTLQNEMRLRTSIDVNKLEASIYGQGFNFSVTNTGNEIISDFNHMDVYTWDGSSPEFQRYIYSTTCGTASTWCKSTIIPDSVHPNQLDPGETLWIWATFTGVQPPTWYQVTTGNGVNAQTTYP